MTVNEMLEHEVSVRIQTEFCGLEDGISGHAHHIYFFVCVEVLRPNQPNGVMSSVVSFPNHMFTGQA